MRNKDLEKYISKIFLDVNLGRTEEVLDRQLTPDSRITIIKGGFGLGKFFALYEEDAVLRMGDITRIIEDVSGMRVRKYFKPKETNPEPNEYYPVRPEGWDEIAEYAALDGIYYTFLAEFEQE